jgi:hypothetical protein
MNMAFANRQAAFLAASAARPSDDIPSGMAAALQWVVDVIRDAKKVDANVLKLQAATKAHDLSVKLAVDADQRREAAEADIAKAQAAIAKLHADHEKACKTREAAIAVADTQARNLVAQARNDAAKAAEARAEASRRLANVEKAVAGS